MLTWSSALASGAGTALGLSRVRVFFTPSALLLPAALNLNWYYTISEIQLKFRYHGDITKPNLQEERAGTAAQMYHITTLTLDALVSIFTQRTANPTSIIGIFWPIHAG